MNWNVLVLECKCCCCVTQQFCMNDCIFSFLASNVFNINRRNPMYFSVTYDHKACGSLAIQHTRAQLVYEK